jgi:hypothetical protein
MARRSNTDKTPPTNKFGAPIPGMSLTTTPGNRPWENPPRYTDTEDVIKFYFNSISSEERMQELYNILERDVPVDTLVDIITTGGVMNGVHTVESGMLAAPVISEYIESLAEIENIKYVSSSSDLRKRTPEAERKRFESLLQEQLDDYRERELMEEEKEEEVEESTDTEPKGKGLMAKPIALLAEVEEMPTEDSMMDDDVEEQEETEETV